MAEKVIMPKAGMAMEEGTIVKWFKKEGDPVKTGEPLLEILTDKVNMEVEALSSGILLKVLKGEGDVVPVTEAIAYIGEAGEKIEVSPDPVKTPEKKAEEKVSEVSEDKAISPLVDTSGRVAATPLAKTLAKEKGIDLNTIKGTGSFGQILARDVEGAKAVQVTPLAKRIAEDRDIDLAEIKGSGYKGKIRKEDLALDARKIPQVHSNFEKAVRKPIAGMRKVIGDRMLTSYLQAPHVTLNSKADVTELAMLRDKLNAASEVKISYNDFILRAVALSLRGNPFVNVSIDGEDLVYKEEINIGMAVALEDGLIVPVIRDADQLSVREMATKSKELAGKAREGKLMPDEYIGGTFTVTNLGMYGVTSFTPIINPPESAILGACAIEEELKMVNDKIENRLFMGLSLTFDHRAMDGAQGAIFLKALRLLLENPYRLVG